MVARRGDRNFGDTFWSSGALARDRAARDVRARAAGCNRAAAAEITAALEAQEANQRATLPNQSPVSRRLAGLIFSRELRLRKPKLFPLFSCASCPPQSRAV